MLGEYGIYGQIRAILTAMFNSLMPSLNSRSLPFVVFLDGFPSRCQNLSSGAIRPGGLLSLILTLSFYSNLCSGFFPYFGKYGLPRWC